MLIRYYWDEAGAFIASDDAEFDVDFDAMCAELGNPSRVRIGSRQGPSVDYAVSVVDERDDEEADDYDDSMDGDAESALASAGFGTDEDYGGYDEPADWG